MLYVSGGLFVLVSLNLLVYNALSGFESVSYGKNMSDRYQNYQELTVPAYLDRMPKLGLELVATLGGAVDLRETDDDYVTDAALWAVSLLALVGVVWQWRLGNPLPALLLAGSAVMIPLFNPKYNLLMNGRYLVPLLPVLFATLGALSAAVHDRLSRFDQASLYTRSGLDQVVPLILDLATVLLVLHPLFYLRTYYAQAPHIPYNNAPFFEGLAQVESNRQAGENIIIDDSLRYIDIWRAAGSVESGFRLALSLEQVPNRTVKLDPSSDLLDPAQRCRDQLVVLAPRLNARDDDLIATLDLRALDHSPRPPAPDELALFGLYRLDRLANASAIC